MRGTLLHGYDARPHQCWLEAETFEHVEGLEGSWLTRVCSVPQGESYCITLLYACMTMLVARMVMWPLISDKYGYCSGNSKYHRKVV